MYRFVVLCLCLAGAAAETQCSTNALAADRYVTCDERRCPLEEFTCDGDKCECRTGHGEGELLCAAKDDNFASIINDPMAYTSNKRQGTHLPLPCMFLFSHVKTTLSSFLSKDVTCDIRVYPYNKRVAGKMYVGGYRVNVQTWKDGAIVDNMVYTVDGESNSQNGVSYCYDMAISKDGGATFHTENLKTNRDLRIDRAPFTFTTLDDHRSKLQLANCGLTVLFRPPDENKLSNQDWLPGFAIKYDTDRAPQYLSKDQVVSLAPGERIDENLFEHLNARALESVPGYTYPTMSAKCEEANSNLNMCGDAVSAVGNCSVLLRKPQFVTCYSKDDGASGVNSLMDLYSSCIKAYCTNEVNQCETLKNTLTRISAPCREHAPSLDCSGL